MIKKKYIFVLVSIVFTLVIMGFLIHTQLKKGEYDVISNKKYSVDEKLNKAEERNDIDELGEKMPWLEIISARWKHIMLNDNNEWIPGPTDFLSIGLLTLDSNYLNEIHEKFQWYENTRREIPNTFLQSDMEGYVLYSSPKYKESYMPLFYGRDLVFFIDFEKEIVLFSFS